MLEARGVNGKVGFLRAVMFLADFGSSFPV